MTNINRPTVAQVLPLAQAIYARHNSGCCLHILLDDGNLSDTNADFCIHYAWEQQHLDCYALALLLRTMTRSQRARVGAKI